ncbi:hypothetical protein [Saccharococcus caldoxylosilyticus]|uniref:hypothetical protein n=1 Tax=Saccharococcus caldoxylosilyticus TaxID=81408 RepID=UPI001C4DECA3|nr:hypothetical protein [Parageobacillus caldoxylosilyticus]QXJ39055.1 hypothetical protein BV455_02420 [Parageobacillus caldoxylosilyticus]BDG37255.1 hypothetical protein PcaKH15_31610 [Parageobacillus caldoxylosilyticus]BDG41046.1 hypothetical protein PcaKH16_31850 [Parageobacillus caldoxylosilyticus]BDG44800.1 hypothetical protein PcaKH35_31450 [Parageobacillus caldoxylosilyticus]
MQSGNIENFKYLSQFRDIKDFNNNIEQWMIDIKNKFTKSELVALKRLIRFSAKVAGVCNAKIGTIVSSTHEKDEVGISRSTFKRMVAKAKKLGLLVVYGTVRKNGSKSSNVYVFNRYYPSVEPSKNEKLNQPQTDNLSETNNQNNNNIRNTEVNYSEQRDTTLDASFVSERVPKQFVNLVKCFFNDAKKIEEYWKLVEISARKNSLTSDILETAIQAFKILVRKIKFSRVTNTYGFFYGVLNKKFKAIYWKELFNYWWESDTH